MVTYWEPVKAGPKVSCCIEIYGGNSKPSLPGKTRKIALVSFFKGPYNDLRHSHTFTLGVCNGCQFLTRLKDLISGAESWPNFTRNVSEQYEARFSMVEVLDDTSAPSVFLHGMKGSVRVSLSQKV